MADGWDNLSGFLILALIVVAEWNYFRLISSSFFLFFFFFVGVGGVSKIL